LAALTVGTVVRGAGLGAKGISHPEAYIPGIDLPGAISEPPPRHAFAETASYHLWREPHPFGYYLAMWGWTKIFGASLTSIRAPEAILGVLSIYLIYLVGRSAYGPQVGVIAAALLSLHGFHVFWSQAARMWVPGACLGLLSSWLLLEMTRSGRPRPGFDVAYVMTTVAGVMTVEFYWALLGIQITWTALNHQQAACRIPRTAVIQAMAFMMSGPMLAHGVMLGRNNAAEPPTLEFLRDYFSFGFLFVAGATSERFYQIPPLVSLAVLAASVALIVAGLRACTHETVSPQPASAEMGLLVMCAAGMVLFMLGFAAMAEQRRPTLVVLSALPIVAILFPLISAAMPPSLRRLPDGAERLQRGRALKTLVVLLAFVPTLVIFAVSFKLTLTAPRAFAIFVPYLLVVIAAGVAGVSRRRAAAGVVAVSLAAMFGASTVMLRNTPISLRDYQGLAEVLNPSLGPGDVIFCRGPFWSHTPMFYYVEHARLAADDYRRALERASRPRVWVLRFDDSLIRPEMLSALSDYRVAGGVSARRAEAILYVPAKGTVPDLEAEATAMR
jgi:hypothetical protein